MRLHQPTEFHAVDESTITYPGLAIETAKLYQSQRAATVHNLCASFVLTR